MAQSATATQEQRERLKPPARTGRTATHVQLGKAQGTRKALAVGHTWKPYRFHPVQGSAMLVPRALRMSTSMLSIDLISAAVR